MVEDKIMKQVQVLPSKYSVGRNHRSRSKQKGRGNEPLLKTNAPHPKHTARDKKTTSSQKNNTAEPTLDSFFEATPSVALRAGQAANLYSRDFEMHSKLRARQRNRRRRVTELRWSDLEVGDLLGSGNFSHVYEVKLLRRRIEEVEEDNDFDDFNTINTDVWDMASRWTEAQGPSHEKVSDIWDLVSHSGTLVEEPQEEEEEDQTYALKHLNPGAMKNERQFKANAIDLVLEAKLLANLNHDNIIKLHAVTGGSIVTVFNGGGYFLLLDRLSDTLENRIKDWQTQKKRSKSRSRSRPRSRLRGGKKNNNSKDDTAELSPDQQKLLDERLRSTALGIARGMEYLHSNRIVFRDLKPANVGFNQKGVVKVFDFGLAREIVDPDQRLTGNTGSLRYMAPEVAKHEHYGLKADVYSFGLLLWEILTLDLPFKGLNRVQHAESVVYGNERPEIGNDFCGTKDVQLLIRNCWDANPKVRPNFISVRHSIVTELAANRQAETAKWVADFKAETSAARLRTKLRRKRQGDNGYHRFEDGEEEAQRVSWA